MKVTDKFVLFWGYNDPFSNFYYHPFVHQGITFKWAEQAIMYRKAKFFGADIIANKILEAQTPKECKLLGRSRHIPFKEFEWQTHRCIIYTEILWDKFQVPELWEELKATEGKILAEASPFDKIWGIGLSEGDPRALNPDEWQGKNLLGEVMMLVRKGLKEKEEK